MAADSFGPMPRTACSASSEAVSTASASSPKTPRSARNRLVMIVAPDRIVVYHRGRVLGTTGTFVSGRGVIEFDWDPPRTGSPQDYVVTVEVTGGPGELLTRWSYNLGCPDGR